MQLVLSLLFISAIAHATYSYLRKTRDAEFSKPSVRWQVLESVSVTLAMYVLAQIVSLAIIIVAGQTQGVSISQISQWMSSTPWAQFLYVLVVDAATILMLRTFLRKRSVGFKTLGLTKPELLHIAYALCGYAAYLVMFFVSILIVTKLMPSVDLNQRQELGFDTSVSGFALLPAFIGLVLLPPLIEETVMRGFMFTGLRSKLNFAQAAVITSVVFAAAHLPQDSGAVLWIAGLDTFILSLVLCYLRESTDSLWPSIGVHFIKNSISFIALFNILQYFR